MLCMKKPVALNCVFHDGNAKVVFDFIKNHILYVVVTIPMGRDPFPVIELGYKAKRSLALVEKEWLTFNDAERRASQFYGHMQSIHVPQSHEDRTIYIEPGQWLVIVDDEPVVISDEEFKNTYIEV